MLDDERLELVRIVRDSAGAVAPRGGSLDRVRALRFGSPGFDASVWRQMAELGWIGLRLPAAKGGSGLGMAESIALYEELGRGLVPEPLVAGTLAATMLAATGEAALVEKLLTGVAIVSLAWQGGRDGIDAKGDIAIPRRYVSGAGASAFLLPVQGEGGLCLRLVNVEEADITLVPQQDGSAVATVRVSANAGRIVSGDIGELLAQALDEAALGSAAYLLGVAERAFAITLDYLKQRKQFGQPLAAFQALQHRAADMKIQLTLTRASVQGAATDLDAGIHSRGRSAVVSQHRGGGHRR